MGCLLEEKRLILKSGTIVDATIISAPSSMKNRDGKRDPEMEQTKKSNTWYFGMKVHVGTDPQGMVHTVQVTDAARATYSRFQRPSSLWLACAGSVVRDRGRVAGATDCLPALGPRPTLTSSA